MSSADKRRKRQQSADLRGFQAKRRPMTFFRDLFKDIDKGLLILPFAFAFVSILMMISTAYEDGIVLDRTVIVQTAAYVLGFICVVLIATQDYSIFQDIQKPLYIGSILFLFTPYLPLIGVETYGARSWIDLGITTVQPSEFVKITFILIMADYLRKNRDNLFTFKGVIKAFIYGAPFILIILKEDLGSALVFIIIWILMIFYAGIDYLLFAKCAGLCILAVPVIYHFMADHQKARIDAFLHPDNLSIEANYQVYQSKIAIGSGGFTGKGLFQGTQKELEFLPVRNSDFIFSVIVEEFGFIGGAAVIGLFTWLIYSLVKVAKAAKDLYGGLLVVGIIGMFAFQIFENIGMAIGIMPVTGITLPFLSYGGSSILSNMIALALVINVAIKNRGIVF